MTAASAYGKLAYECVEGATHVTYDFATYPLKFLHPQAMIRPDFGTVATCILGYGGGLVSGDSVHIECKLGREASAVLCTQATTKVYKSDEDQVATQTFVISVGDHATLALVPDPITCFASSRFRQRQTLHLHSTSSLVLVDWVTSGRKRTFSPANDTFEQRTEHEEKWNFSDYDTLTKILVDGKLLLCDRVRLQDNEAFSLQSRMQWSNVLGFLVLLGPRVQVITDLLLEHSRRKRLTNVNEIVPQGRLDSGGSHDSVLFSSSPLGDQGVSVRFSAVSTEQAVNFMRDLLDPLREELGFAPYQENR